MSPFDIVGSVSERKPLDFEDKDYNAFMVNKALSYFPDTVLFANEMNINSHIPQRQQYEFLFNSLRPRRRFSKWFKEAKNEDAQIVAEYYGISVREAKGVIHNLKPEELQTMKSEMSKGGK